MKLINHRAYQINDVDVDIYQIDPDGAACLIKDRNAKMGGGIFHGESMFHWFMAEDGVLTVERVRGEDYPENIGEIAQSCATAMAGYIAEVHGDHTGEIVPDRRSMH
ncbi:MAG: hypothetical protein KF889_04815 [Alphaproteobacteria bacterium]|nr:hypothetical protein [Alphaproteobacteria bacterium]MCW5742189.1 hypothetical protein [Alphaproteobacteria bacterium]